MIQRTDIYPELKYFVDFAETQHYSSPHSRYNNTLSSTHSLTHKLIMELVRISLLPRVRKQNTAVRECVSSDRRHALYNKHEKRGISTSSFYCDNLSKRTGSFLAKN